MLAIRPTNSRSVEHLDDNKKVLVHWPFFFTRFYKQSWAQDERNCIAIHTLYISTVWWNACRQAPGGTTHFKTSAHRISTTIVPSTWKARPVSAGFDAWPCHSLCTRCPVHWSNHDARQNWSSSLPCKWCWHSRGGNDVWFSDWRKEGNSDRTSKDKDLWNAFTSLDHKGNRACTAATLHYWAC